MPSEAIVNISQLQRPSHEPPRILIPDTATLFADRAQRFEHLADGHSLGDWLRFQGQITQAQHQALQGLMALTDQGGGPEGINAFPIPDAERLAMAREHGMPPAPAQSWPRDPIWRQALHTILSSLQSNHGPAVPDTVGKLLTDLSQASPEHLEKLADQVLKTELYGEHAVYLPLVASALQVYWTAIAARLGPSIQPLDVPGVCPCCGFLPVSSMLRIGGEIANLRYLHCALCNTEWNLVRVKCAACDSNEKVSYRQIEGDGARKPDVTRAECCDSCQSYLKLTSQEKDPLADAVADDLATLALDILVDEQGYQRCGPNLLFVPG